MGKRASAAEWAKRVERWRDSGLTAKEYAAETGLNASTLSNWGWRLKSEVERGSRTAGRASETLPQAGSRPSEDVSGSSSPTRLSQPSKRPPASPFVEVTASTPSASVLEVVLGNGVVVRIPAGVDRQTLTQVLHELGAGA